jgi:hypothetical protein
MLLVRNFGKQEYGKTKLKMKAGGLESRKSSCGAPKLHENKFIKAK